MWARAHPGQPHLPLLPSLLGYSFCLETSLLSRVGEQVCQLPGCGFPWTCPLLALQNQPPWGEGTSGPLLPPLLTVLKPEVSSPEVSSNTPWKAGRGPDLGQSCQDVFLVSEGGGLPPGPPLLLSVQGTGTYLGFPCIITTVQRKTSRQGFFVVKKGRNILTPEFSRMSLNSLSEQGSRERHSVGVGRTGPGPACCHVAVGLGVLLSAHGG